MKILSVIIPAYQAQRFLDTCIPSLLHPQVMDQLDIIVVNDGSSDATGEIAEGYRAKYPGIVRVIHQENRGHGGALNTGCAAAVGKYLKVLDADDWVLTENLPQFIDFLTRCDSDVVLTHHHTLDITTGQRRAWRCFPEEFGKPYTLGQILERWRDFERSTTFHGITYRTAFYHKFAISLSEHVFYEDHEYATFPCCHAATVTPVDLFLYQYRVGDVEQSVSDANQCKRIGHTETVLRRFLSEYRAADTLSEDGKAYIAMKAQGLLMSYLTTALLVMPDRRAGRQLAGTMLATVARELPHVRNRVDKKYRIFLAMNRLHISRQTFEKVLNSRLYQKLTKKQSFDA